jgi:hypothetical protein
MTGPNRIDSTPARISTNMTIERQTPKRDFGDRMKAGLDTVGGTLANGAAVVGGLVPGGAILSAAVSSVSQLGGHSTPGGGAASAAYASTGVVNIGGGGGGVNTTIGAGGGNPAATMPGMGSTVGGQPAALGSANSGSGVAGMNADLIQSQKENGELIKVQMSLQRENQVFTSVSNVLKTRHDTVKNSIGNIR